MKEPKRRKNLMSLLERHQSVTVGELCTWLNASVATVRRELAWLAERNLIARTRGGAQYLPAGARRSIPHAAHFQSELCNAAAAKRAIARQAAALCGANETVIINGGTTTYMMAEFLAGKKLTVLTNSFSLAERLLTCSDSDVVLPGGQVFREQNLVLSPVDNDVTSHYYASRMFLGGHAVSMLGLMESDPMLLESVRRLLGQAEQLVLLADSSKFNRRSGALVCVLEQLSHVITDTGVDHATVQMLERAGLTVDVVAPDYQVPEYLM